MSLLNLNVPRLERAIQRYVKESTEKDLLGIDPKPSFTVRELMDALLRRGMPESSVYSLFCEIIKGLEPAGCVMTRCKHFRADRHMCNCAQEKNPARCPIFKRYQKRHEGLTALVEEAQPLGLQRPQYKTALSLILRPENAK